LTLIQEQFALDQCCDCVELAAPKEECCFGIQLDALFDDFMREPLSSSLRNFIRELTRPAPQG